MKQLADYKFKQVMIRVTSNGEWRALYPLLNQVFTNYKASHYKDACSAAGEMFIDMESDNINDYAREDYEILPATDFIEVTPAPPRTSVIKELKDYKNKQVQILVTSKIEWRIFRPLLNKVFPGYRADHYKDECNDDGEMYVDMENDCCDNAPCGWEVIPAIDFIKPMEPVIINSYSVY